MNYPTIGEYNQALKANGGAAFNTLGGINIFPSRTVPIPVYLFGSGAYAAVFKGNYNGQTYALRCFLSAENETIQRARVICDYLRNLNESWIVRSDFLENEICVNGSYFPVVKMEWVEGKLINQFVTTYLDDNRVLSMLQRKMIAISQSLEENRIGHGDIQCGNIIVKGDAQNFDVKLIDYDGMYVPELMGKNSIENGRSEFQRPGLTLRDFNHEIDRFSIWVIITALEALKHDKTLWREVMQGGFNSLDNFLFSAQDFQRANQSNLFNRLLSLRVTALNFYTETLIWLCNNPVSIVPPPKLYEDDDPVARNNSNSEESHSMFSSNSIQQDFTKYKIFTHGVAANVLTSSLQKLGVTPIELEREAFVGKTILISNGVDMKIIKLGPDKGVFEIVF